MGYAPINSFGQNYKNAAVGAIGSLVGTLASNTNVTRAIWNQIGLDITFMPAVQYANAGNFLTSGLSTPALIHSTVLNSWPSPIRAIFHWGCRRLQHAAQPEIRQPSTCFSSIAWFL